MSSIIHVPEADIQAVAALQKSIEEIDIIDDNSAIIIGQLTRKVTAINKKMSDCFKEAAGDANKRHKAVTKERSVVLSDGTTAEAMGRVKLEMWANEQYELAKEAADNGATPTRLFPDIDGVTLNPVLEPAIVNFEAFCSWCIDTGNLHLIKADTARLKKYVNSAGTQARSIPGANVKVQYSVTIRTEK